MTRARWAGVLSLAVLAAAGVCTAAPPSSQDRPARRAPGEPGSPPPASVDSADLEMRVEFLKAELARHERALALAKSGASEDEIRAAIAPLGPRTGGPENDGPPPPARGPELPWQEIKERVLALLKDRNPDFHNRLQELAKNHPNIAERMIRALAPRLHELGRIQKEDPTLFDIRLDEMRADFDLRRAAMDYARLKHNLPKPPRSLRLTDEPEPRSLDEAVARLTAAVERRYDVAVREKQHNVAMLAERLERVRDEINRAGPDRDAEINKRVREITSRLDRDPPRNPGPDAAEHGRDRPPPR